MLVQTIRQKLYTYLMPYTILRLREFRDHGLGTTGRCSGSYKSLSGVLSPLIWVIGIVTLLITLRICTYGPPSRVFGGGVKH